MFETLGEGMAQRERNVRKEEDGLHDLDTVLISRSELLERLAGSVLRCSLLKVNEKELLRLERVLHTSKVPEVAKMARCVMRYARTRAAVKRRVEEKAFVNLTGGPAGCAAVTRLRGELQGAGLGHLLRVTSGPLLRASEGDTLTHMPLATASAYKIVSDATEEAWRRANADPADPDPELDLAGAATPRWGNHTWRRLADKVARATRLQTAVSETDIDLFFGWNEAELRKKMSLHYAGRSDRERRAAVTSML